MMETPPTARARPVPGQRTALAALCLLVTVIGCAREPLAPAERIRLLGTPAGAVAPTYTLADETRPVLDPPREWRLELTVDPRQPGRLTFRLPEDLAAAEVVATGLYQRSQYVSPLPPQLLTASADRTATLSLANLPAVGFGDSPPEVALVLTTPPPARSVERAVDAATVPPDAELHLAFGLGEAARLEGAAPVVLEVVAADDRDGSEHVLSSTTLRPGTPEAHRWQERVIPLGDLAGRRVRFIFRARALGDGRAVLVPLWADPTIIALAPRPASQRNVILISLDTLRADRVGVYGSYRPTTPNIDALAAESVVFSDAWSVWPETCGSHMSLFTSLYPSEHGVTHILTTPAASVELLAERLRRAGYLTRAFTEDGNVWAHAGFARGFSAYSERRTADRVYRGEILETFGDATRWLETHADRTFFLFVHTYEVHRPYSPPAEYGTLFADIPGREPGNMAVDALGYDRETHFTDVQVGKLIGSITRLGLADRSIVVILSDHGEEFGEHGNAGHWRTLYREVLQVPLIVWAPGLLAPARIDAPVTLLDVVPTILDLLELPSDANHRGRSLVRAARGDPPVDQPIFGELDDRLVSVRTGGRTAIINLKENSTQCYAADDPAEQRPSARCPDLVELIAGHRAAAVPAGKNQPAPPIDPRLAQKMRALGYIE